MGPGGSGYASVLVIIEGWSRVSCSKMSTNMKQLKRIIEEVLKESFADLEEMFSNEADISVETVQFSTGDYIRKR